MTAFALSDSVEITNVVSITGSVGINGITFPETLSVTGSLRLTEPVTTTLGSHATRTSVSASLTDVLLASENLARLDVIIYNDSNASLYVGLGTSPVSIDDFSFVVASHAERALVYAFRGEIRGFWQSATGLARITELT